jgi:hypothetical protein
MHLGYTVDDIIELQKVKNHTFSAVDGFDPTTQQSTG